jgi:hypothetical protein
MLRRGFDRATPLTMRHAGKAYDSVKPVPIGEWGKWSYTESAKHVLKRQAWMPLPVDREGQESGVEPAAGTAAPLEKDSLVRRSVSGNGTDEGGGPLPFATPSEANISPRGRR